MTSIKKNFKSQKVPIHSTRCFDIEKQLTKSPSKDCRESDNTTTKKPQTGGSRFCRINKYVSPSINWQPIDNPYECLENYDDDKGTPFILMPDDDSQSTKMVSTVRKPTCHTVYREVYHPKMECTDVSELIRAIRISICIEHTHFPLIGKVSKGMGFTHVPEHRLWNVQWCDNTPHFDLLKVMKRFQQINHFPGMSEICRKDLLSRNLNRMLKMYPVDYRIFPRTWLLPTDAYDVHAYACKHKRTFILKPYSSGMGRGIWLTNNLRNVGKKEKLICQTYIEKPLLIDGFKFDLRVYTLVTSVDPLRIFVYNEGLARFATNKYKPPGLGTSDNLFMHLTNYCVNRRNCNYDSATGTDKGSKRKLSAYNKWLKDHNYDVNEFWATVDDAIIKTLISAWPMLKHNYHLCFPKHDKIQACFQLLGFDILVDWKLKPFILEVNHMPSLSGGEPVDFEVKRPLIRDTLSLISTPLVDKEEIIREDRALQRDRQLRQLHRRRVMTPIRDSSSRAAGGGDRKDSNQPSALDQQIAWEETHLGNYRRVMPPTDSNRINYYYKFYNQYKPEPLFKDNNISQSYHKPMHEFALQKTLNKQLRNESLKLCLWRQRKSFNAGSLIANNHQNFTQMLKENRIQALAILKDLHMQKQKREKNPARRRKTTNQQPMKILKDQLLSQQQSSWQVKTTEESESESKIKGSTPHQRSRRSHKRKKLRLVIAKARRRAQHRQIQKRIKRARSLEEEEPLPSNDPAEQLAPKLSETSSAESIGETKWLPQPISPVEEMLHIDWREERAAAIEAIKLQELLFHQMYKHGHLSKTDINQRPDLLYDLLKAKGSR